MKLRLSYSLLATWERGNVDDAVATYFHLGGKSTPQIDFGVKFHQDIRDHIEMYNTFPEWFFKKGLLVPHCEKEVIVPYNDKFDLKAIFDCWDCPDLYEFKTGVQPSSDWARTMQVPFYFLVADIAQTEVEKAYVIRHDQYKKNTDFSVLYNSERLRNKAKNMIDSVGPEIYSYFESQGLLYEKPNKARPDQK